MRLGNVPSGPARQYIRERSTSVTIRRPVDDGNDSAYDSREYTTDGTRQLWLFGPRSQPSQFTAGEASTGGLSALCLPDVDVRDGDRVVHGGVTYEANEPVGEPSDDDPVYHSVQFDRVVE